MHNGSISTTHRYTPSLSLHGSYIVHLRVKVESVSTVTVLQQDPYMLFYELEGMSYYI